MALSGTVEHATAADGTFSAAGALAWDGTGAHTVVLTGIASAAQGGTGIAYFTAAGPTVARVYTFPDAAATILYAGGDLGTPSAGVATNLTGTAAGLTAGTVTTNQTITLTGPITGSGTGSFATAVAAQTGTGSTFVMQASPTLTTPVIGAATGTSVVLSGGISSFGTTTPNSTFTDTFDASGTSAVFVRGSADANPFSWIFLKARGTVAAPTAITTGDTLGTLTSRGYVGATNTFVVGARMQFVSTGAISDTATGLGGMIKFGHSIVGSSIATVLSIKSQHLIHEGTSPTITAGGGTNPTIVGKDEAFEVTVGTGGVATSVEVTFGHAFTTNAPICVAQSDTDIVAFKCVTTTTKVTITAALAFTAGSILHVMCRGWE